jgi:hypothetical protein
MPKFKSLLRGCRVVHAGRLRKCYHDPKHQIKKGDIVLEVKNNMHWQGYCRGCAAQMLEEASELIQARRHAIC